MNGESEMNKTTGTAPEKLPALPEPIDYATVWDRNGAYQVERQTCEDYYTAEQMRAYALQAIAEAAPLAEGREALALLRTLPTKVETLSLAGLNAEECAIFDSGYNACLDRVHLLLSASVAPANEAPCSPKEWGFVGGDGCHPTAQRVAAGDGPIPLPLPERRAMESECTEQAAQQFYAEGWNAALAASPPRGEAVGVVDGVGRGNEISTRATLFKPLPTGTKLYTHPAAQADARGDLAGWIADGDTIPKPIINACRDAICLEFGNNGTDGYYKRILVKVFAALAAPVAVGPDHAQR